MHDAQCITTDPVSPACPRINTPCIYVVRTQTGAFFSFRRVSEIHVDYTLRNDYRNDAI